MKLSSNEKSIYRNRREALLNDHDNSLCIILGNNLKNKNSDTEFRFRQDSNYFYFTGIDEENGILLLIKKNGVYKEHIFLLPRDGKMEQWEGERIGKGRANDYLGINTSSDLESFDSEFSSYAKGMEVILYDSQNSKLHSRIVQNLKRVPRRASQPLVFKNYKQIIGKMRSVKSDFEIELMKKSQGIAIEAHKAAMALAKPGLYEYEIEALISYIFRKNGAKGEAYHSIVASGDKANTLHYIVNNRKILDNELILIDAGCEYEYYASDITRTFPANGKFSSAQKDVYNIVLESQKKCIERISPGRGFKEGHEVVEKILVQGLIDLKILSGSLDENLENKKYKTYYPHSTSHWLGLDVHDVGDYSVDGVDACLLEGQILTVEPGLYLPENDLGIPQELRGIGVRIEDDILVTASGHENLTAGLAREVSDIENLCNINYLEYIK